MAKRITEYTNIETIAESDVLPIVDVSDTEQATTGSTRKGTVGKIADYIKDRAETLTNKILTTARLNTPKINEDVTVTATSTELNKLDGMAGDAVGTTDTQTLTNKTLTAPALSSPTISGAWDGWISAGETWTYASADDPTFTFTVAADVTTKYSAGMKIKLTQGTVKYFIITAVSTYSGGNTTITVYGGTDYDLANSAISANAYSMMRTPAGFPMSPAKWSVTVTDTVSRSATPAQNVWTNIGTTNTQISVPIGVWDLSYSVRFASSAVWDCFVTLATVNNDYTDGEFNFYLRITGASAYMQTAFREKTVNVTSKTTYYLNAVNITSTSSTLFFFGADVAPTVLRAVCAYL